MVLGRFGEDIDAAIALIDRALVLNPSFAFAWYWSGWLRLFAGDTDLAIQHFETSMRLNPRGQRGYHLSGIGMVHFLNRRFNDALAVLRVSLEEVPIFTATYSGQLPIELAPEKRIYVTAPSAKVRPRTPTPLWLSPS